MPCEELAERDLPETTRIRARLVTWDDGTLFPEGTIDYYERVLDTHGSTPPVQEFARLFMAPGSGHCVGGAGPSAFDPFDALVRWVEHGEPPDQIAAARIEGGQIVRTRPLCAYPDVARYDGEGDPDTAESFTCEPDRWTGA